MHLQKIKMKNAFYDVRNQVYNYVEKPQIIISIFNTKIRREI